MLGAVEESFNGKSSKIRGLVKLYLLSCPLLWQTKKYKDKALDLGCGWGFYFKINPLAYGIDANPKALEYLKKKNFKVVSGDIAEKLPFANNSFKCVVCHDVLEHFYPEDIKKIFNNVYNILEPNGIFLILVPNKKGFLGMLSAGHKTFIDLKEIISFSQKKFTVKKHFFYPFSRPIGKYFFHNKQIFYLTRK